MQLHYYSALAANLTLDQWSRAEERPEAQDTDAEADLGMKVRAVL